MNFSQIEIGQRFVYRGRIHRKETPLLASPEDGQGSRLVPRSAQVEPLEQAARDTRPTQPVAWSRVDQAMQALALEINRIVGESGMNPSALERRLGEVQVAFERAREHLKRP